MWKKIPERTYLLEITKVSGILFYSLLSSIYWIVSLKGTFPINSVIYIHFLELIPAYISVSLLYITYSYINKKKIEAKKIFVYILIPTCCLSSLTWDVLSNLSLFFYTKKIDIIGNNFLGNFHIYLLYSFAFTGIYYVINHWLNLRKQKDMTLMATNLANEAQLQMLRYQINPHFLFNALNTIRSMVEEDKAVARKMITELSNFFRYSLSHNGTMDTFENEINAIKNYLEIQKIRFEEKLIVEYDIDEKLYSMKIPFFIILPLVENAIKFGLQTGKPPLTIKICAKVNHNLEISVYNTGRIIENTNADVSTKTGIENTKKRLALYFPDSYSFKLFEDSSWVVAQIVVKDFRNLLQA